MHRSGLAMVDVLVVALWTSSEKMAASSPTQAGRVGARWLGRRTRARQIWWHKEFGDGGMAVANFADDQGARRQWGEGKDKTATGPGLLNGYGEATRGTSSCLCYHHEAAACPNLTKW